MCAGNPEGRCAPNYVLTEVVCGFEIPWPVEVRLEAFLLWSGEKGTPPG